MRWRAYGKSGPRRLLGHSASARTTEASDPQHHPDGYDAFSGAAASVPASLAFEMILISVGSAPT